MADFILPHHRDTIAHLTEHFRADSRYRALLIGGSIIKGYARPDSDVDVMLITTDAAYAEQSEKSEFTFYRADLSTYEGGYVDGKFLDYQFLLDAAERGSEPTRWSFKNAIIAFSDIPDLESLIRRIAQYPDHEQAEKIRSFYGQFILMNWFVGEAQRHNNAYLMARASTDLVLFGCRLILAHNKVLYPYHKWMMAEIERTPNKPDQLIPLAEALLKNPNPDTANAFADSIKNFYDWGISVREAVDRFAEDSERTWLQGRPALADW